MASRHGLDVEANGPEHWPRSCEIRQRRAVEKIGFGRLCHVATKTGGPSLKPSSCQPAATQKAAPGTRARTEGRPPSAAADASNSSLDGTLRHPSARRLVCTRYPRLARKIWT